MTSFYVCAPCLADDHDRCEGVDDPDGCGCLCRSADDDDDGGVDG